MIRRGFATLIALVLVGLVAAALSAMAVAGNIERTRTNRQRTAASLRQLLQAGAIDAAHRARDWPSPAQPTGWSIKLPSAMNESAATLEVRVTPDGPTKAVAHIAASCDHHPASQELIFTRTGQQWEATGVQFDITAASPK